MKAEIENNNIIEYYKVLCPCQTELEIDEGTTKTCPNCGLELDDRGIVQYT